MIVPFHLSSEDDERRTMIQELIRSIPEHPGCEVILVDDNSLFQIEEEEVQKSLTVVRVMRLPKNENNRFAGAARNYGLQHAQGSWVTFFDSDDIVSTPVLEELIGQIDQSQYDDYDMIISPMSSFKGKISETGDRHTSWNRAFHAWVNGKPKKRKILLSRMIGPYNRILKREHLLKNDIKFHTSQYGNDIAFSLLCAAKIDKVFAFKDSYYNLRQGHNSLVTTINENAVSVRLQARRQANKLMKEIGHPNLRLRYIRKILEYRSLGIPFVLHQIYLFGKEDPSLLLPPAQAFKNRIKKAIGQS